MSRSVGVSLLCGLFACGGSASVAPDAGGPAGGADAGSTGADNADAGSRDAGGHDAGPRAWLEVAPALQIADGAAQISVTLHARGPQGAPLAGKPAKLIVTPQAVVAPTAAGVTDGAGELRANLSSTSSGVRAIVAYVDGASVRGSVTFQAGAADAAHSTLEVLPPTAAADGRSLASARVLVRDRFGNPVPGAPVALQVGSGGAVVHGALAGVTDERGLFSVGLTNAAVEDDALSATAAGFPLSATAHFSAGAVSSALSRLETGALPVLANGQAAAALALTAVDAHGNPIQDQPVLLSASGTDHAFKAADAKTSSTGAASAKLISAVTGTKTVVASVGAVEVSTQVRFVGAPWNAQVSGLGGGALLSIVFEPGGATFASSLTGIYRSLDHGDSWTRLQGGNSLGVPRLDKDPTDPQTLYARTISALLKTTDGGISWSAIGTGFIGESNGTIWLQALAIDPTDPQTLYATGLSRAYRSNDGGATWSLLVSVGDLGAGSFWDISIDPFAPARLFLGTDVGGFVSADSGNTWSAMAALPHQRLAVIPDARAQGRLYASTDGSGLLVSTDGGASFGPLLAAVQTRLPQLSMVTADPSQVLATGFSGVYLAGLDGTATQITPPGTSAPTAIAADPGDPSRIFAALSAGGTPGVGVALLRSEDSGADWFTSNAGIAELKVTALAIDPTEPHTLYSSAADFSKTTDSGVSWVHPTSDLPPGNDSIQIAVDPAAPSTVLDATNAGVYRSADGGLTFSFTLAQQAYVTFSLATPHLVYAGTLNGHLFVSADGGATWAELTAPASGWLRILTTAADPRTLYCLSEDVDSGLHPQLLFRSIDAGASWTSLAGLPYGSLVVDGANPQQLYFLGSHPSFLTSTDGGATFQAPPGPAPFAGSSGDGYMLAQSPSGRLWAGFSDSLFRSDDRGASWQRADLGLFGALVFSVAFDPGAPDTLYVGTYASGISSTTTGGVLAETIQ